MLLTTVYLLITQHFTAIYKGIAENVAYYIMVSGEVGWFRLFGDEAIEPH